MQELSYLQIDLGKITENFKTLQKALSQYNAKQCLPKICAVIKKNGYGLGAVAIGKTLIQEGCDMLGVFSAKEANELIEADITASILILGPFGKVEKSDAIYSAIKNGKIHITIHSLEELEYILSLSNSATSPIPLHIYIDTGMSRGGVNDSELKIIAEKIDDAKNVYLAGVYSHPAKADDDEDFTFYQLQILQKKLKDLPNNKCLIHIANTFATLRSWALHLDMIRPGLGLLGYGANTIKYSNECMQINLNPALRWISKIVHLQHYKKGASVGYGSIHFLKRDSILGVVPVGYGDGYPLALSNKAIVRVSIGKDSQNNLAKYIINAPVLGKVNMDQIVIDLTDAFADNSAVKSLNELQPYLGAPVEIISDKQTAPNSLENLAKLAGSHCHEMLCRLSPRLPRQYL